LARIFNPGVAYGHQFCESFSHGGLIPKYRGDNVRKIVDLQSGSESVYSFGQQAHRSLTKIKSGSFLMDTRTVIIWLVIGIVAGFLASILVGGSGLIRYLITGILGAFVGGFLAQTLNIKLNLGHPLADQIAIATLGAIVVVIAARIIA